MVKSQPGCGFGRRWLLWGVGELFEWFSYLIFRFVVSVELTVLQAAVALSECTHSVFPVMKMMMNA